MSMVMLRAGSCNCTACGPICTMQRKDVMQLSRSDVSLGLRRVACASAVSPSLSGVSCVAVGRYRSASSQQQQSMDGASALRSRSGVLKKDLRPRLSSAGALLQSLYVHNVRACVLSWMAATLGWIFHMTLLTQCVACVFLTGRHGVVCRPSSCFEWDWRRPDDTLWCDDTLTDARWLAPVCCV